MVVNLLRPDICLVQVPYVFSWGMVAPATAMLNAYLRQKGFRTETLDLHAAWNLIRDRSNDSGEEKMIQDTCTLDYPTFLDNAQPTMIDFLDNAAIRIAEMKPRIVGLSITFRPAWMPAIYLAKRIKELLPCVTVAGGAAFDQSVSNHIGVNTPAESIDLYCFGEGELALERLVDITLSANKIDSSFLNSLPAAIPGIGRPMPNQGLDIHIPITNTISSLDELPFSDFSGYDLSAVETLPLTIARSCNARCAFCSSRRTPSAYRMLSGKRVVDELIYLASKHGIRQFYFTSPIVNGDMKKFRDLCNELIIRDADIKLLGLFRHTRKLTEDDIDLAVRAGFCWMKFGLESGSPKVRKDMRKLPDNEHSLRTMKAVSDRGAKLLTNIMHSFPTENEEHFNETLDFLSHFTPAELEWNAWPFNLGFTGNGVLDEEFVKRFGIRIKQNHGLATNIAGFVLQIDWENDQITPTIRRHRQTTIQAFKKDWLDQRPS